jgi:hypothetical protein
MSGIFQGVNGRVGEACATSSPSPFDKLRVRGLRVRRLRVRRLRVRRLRVRRLRVRRLRVRTY